MSFAEAVELRRRIADDRLEIAHLRRQLDACRRRAQARDDALMAIGRFAIDALPTTDDREEILRRLSWDEPLTAIELVKDAFASVRSLAARGTHAAAESTKDTKCVSDAGERL